MDNYFKSKISDEMVRKPDPNNIMICKVGCGLKQVNFKGVVLESEFPHKSSRRPGFWIRKMNLKKLSFKNFPKITSWKAPENQTEECYVHFKILGYFNAR